MHYLNAVLFQVLRPGFRISCRSKNNLHAFLDDDLYVLVQVGIQQGNVHTKGFRSSCLAFTDMRAQHLGVHAARTQHTQAARIAYRARELPTAGPDHAGLDDRIIDIEEFGDTVLEHKWKVKSKVKSKNSKIEFLLTKVAS